MTQLTDNELSTVSGGKSINWSTVSKHIYCNLQLLPEDKQQEFLKIATSYPLLCDWVCANMYDYPMLQDAISAGS